MNVRNYIKEEIVTENKQLINKFTKNAKEETINI